MPQIRILPIETVIAFEGPESRSLMEHLTCAGVPLDSECGGAGRCGKCLVELVEGTLLDLDGAPAAPVRDSLFEACGCRPDGDCVLRVQQPGEDRRFMEYLFDLEVEEPGGSDEAQRLGVAVDVGTTTVVAMLVELESRRPVALESETNPQRVHGADIMSRIAYAASDAGGTAALQSAVIDCVNRLVEKLLERTGRSADAIEAVVCAGNTAMQHFLLGIEPVRLGTAPYEAEFLEAEPRPATSVGMDVAEAAVLRVLPNIGGFIGGDTVGCLLAVTDSHPPVCRMMVDMGTNTEIVLDREGRRAACSAAAGPAFEGAHIEHGMRAAPGAIESACVEDGRIAVRTIGGEPPVGICGSGIVDVLAAMKRLGIVETNGKMSRFSEYVLVPASRTGTGRDITVTRRDIREIQLVKASIATGAMFLLEELEAEQSSLEKMYVAGAFGNYLDIDNAVYIGLLPDLARDRFASIGDGALKGAFMCLTGGEKTVEQASALARGTTHLELAGRPGFQDRFLSSLELTSR